MCTGITGLITSVAADADGLASAAVAGEDGRPLTASLLTCPQARCGDIVLIHSGFVLKILQEGESRD